MAGNADKVLENNKKVATEMARKLREDVRALAEFAKKNRVDKFDRYKAVRLQYRAIQQLIDNTQRRLKDLKQHQPAGLQNAVMRDKILALRAFTKISEYFFQNAPPTVTQAIGARELLTQEAAAFKNAYEYFDMMMLEAGLDDKTADTLEKTREEIETIMKRIDELLGSSPAELAEF